MRLRVCMLGLLLAGCANYTQPVGRPPDLTPAERNFQAVWQASLDVLREYQFEVARTDRRQGLIVSEPTVGRQWFELWRKDAATPRDVSEGTFQTIYRTITIQIAPVSPGQGVYVAAAQVHTERTERPSPQITSVADARGMFALPGSERNEADMILNATPAPRDQVQDLGIDGTLSERITGEIAQRVGPQMLAVIRPATTSAPATGPAPLPEPTK
jgi:hypothetical protein